MTDNTDGSIVRSESCNSLDNGWAPNDHHHQNNNASPPPQHIRTIAQFGQAYPQLVQVYSVSTATAKQLSSGLVKVLNTEGCPLCLSSSLSSTGDTAGDEPALLVLTCRALRCRHLVHFKCLNLLQQQQRSSSPLPTLAQVHTTSLMRTIYFQDRTGGYGTQRSSERSSYARPCSFNLTLRHLVSNTRIATFADGSGTCGLTKTGNDCAVFKVDPVNTPAFSVQRGRILFTCVSPRTGQTVIHDCTYDLSRASVSVAPSKNRSKSNGHSSTSTSSGNKAATDVLSARLVLLDAKTLNVLTLGLFIGSQQRQLALDAGGDSPSYQLSFVRYEWSKHVPFVLPDVEPIVPRTSSSPVSTRPPLYPTDAAATATTGDRKMSASNGRPSPPTAVAPAAAADETPATTEPVAANDDDTGARVRRKISPRIVVEPQTIADPARASPYSSEMYTPGSLSPTSQPSTPNAFTAMYYQPPASPLHPQQMMHGAFPYHGVPYASGMQASQPPPQSPQHQQHQLMQHQQQHSRRPQQQPPQQQPYRVYYGDMASPHHGPPPPSPQQHQQAAVAAAAVQYMMATRSPAHSNRNSPHHMQMHPHHQQQPPQLSPQQQQQQQQQQHFSPYGSPAHGGDRRRHLSPNGRSRSGSGNKPRSDWGAAASSPSDLKDHVMEMCRTHDGSRFVQDAISSGRKETVEMIKSEMMPNLITVALDGFGHFAVEKLYTVLSDDEMLRILKQFTPSIIFAACHRHGSFSIQALVEAVNSDECIVALTEGLKLDTKQLCLHPSGHFVLLRFLQRFKYPRTKFIVECVCSNVLDVCTDHHGLRVVKALLKSDTDMGVMMPLYNEITRLTSTLVVDQYGNYAVQACLDVSPESVCQQIRANMKGNYLEFSKQKFSSNVVERSLRQSDRDWRSVIIGELTVQPGVGEVLCDRFGNYSLQTALSVADETQVDVLANAITPHLPSLRDKVRVKWEMLLHKAKQRVMAIADSGGGGGGGGGAAGGGGGGVGRHRHKN